MTFIYDRITFKDYINESLSTALQQAYNGESEYLGKLDSSIADIYAQYIIRHGHKPEICILIDSIKLEQIK